MTHVRIWPRRPTAAKRLVVALQRVGFTVGALHLLSVPDRRGGKMHGTPVSTLTVDGRRYVVGLVDAGWIDHARDGGWAFLGRGRVEERVALHELPPAEHGPILRRSPRPVASAASAPRWSVFRIERLPVADRPHPGR